MSNGVNSERNQTVIKYKIQQTEQHQQQQQKRIKKQQFSLRVGGCRTANMSNVSPKLYK